MAFSTNFEFLMGIGPSFDAPLLLGDGLTVAPTGYSMASTTSVDSYSPPTADFYVKATGTGLGGRNLYKTGTSYTSKGVDYLVWREFVCEGALTGSKAYRIAVVPVTTDGFLFVEIVEDGGGSDDYFFRLTRTSFRTLVANGSTSFSSGISAGQAASKCAIRLQLDGTNATLWVNGTQEIQAAYTKKIDEKTMIIDARDLDSGMSFYWNGGFIASTTTTNDRPGTSVEVKRPDGNGDTTTDYGDEADCSTTNGTYTDVNLHATAFTVQTANYLCEQGGANGTFEMDTETLSFTGTVMGGVWRSQSRANTGTKTVATLARIIDKAGTPNVNEIQNSNLGSTSWTSLVTPFTDPPDTTALWSSLTLADLEVGIRSVNTNGANDEHAAIFMELFAVDEDPPAAAPAGVAPQSVMF